MSRKPSAVSPTWDAVVVGAGLGGLSAAAFLAAAGKRVLLLEKYTTLGGSSHVFRRRGRWEFDCGVHYVGECGTDGMVSKLIRGLGIDDRIEWLPMDNTGFDRIIGPDFELATPVGWDAYLDNLIDAFPGEEKAIRRFHSTMRRIGEASDRFTSQGSVAGMTRWAARSGRGPIMAVPYAAFLRACGLSTRTMLALSAQCGALASLPTQIPTAAMAAFFQDYVGGGSYYPRGGGQMLAAGFAEVITSHGGAIRTKSAVTRIVVEAGHVAGVLLADGELIKAPTVVSDVDAIKTFTELVGLDHTPRLLRERVKRWKMSQPLINGFFGVSHDVSSQPNSNYFAIPSWDDAHSLRSLLGFSRKTTYGKGFTDGAAWARELAARQPMFVQSSSRRDPSNHRAAPAGCSTIEVQTIVPYSPQLWGFAGYDVDAGEYSNDAAYSEVKKIVIDGMLDRMEQAFPGSSSKVELAELGSPATQERFVGNTHGAPFGLAQRLSQIGPLRPGVGTPIPGLYMVGTNSPYGPGTAGSMLSGLHAAATITGRDLVSEIRADHVVADVASLSKWSDDFDPLNATRRLA